MDVRGQWALICVLVVLGCSIALVPIGSASGVGSGEHGVAALQEEPTESPQLEEADEIHIDVFIHENGSATFTIDYRYVIDEENRSEEEWDELRNDVEANPDAYAASEEDRWSETLADGRETTGRDMDIANVAVSTDESSAPRELGHVEFTFEWSSFAHVELNRIEAGDAISGFTIPADTTLQFRWPEEYTLHEGPDPSPDDSDENSVFWSDEGTEFSSDQPRVVLIENASNESEPTDTDEEPSMPWIAVVAALLLLATVGAAGWWIRGEQARTQESARDSSLPAPDRPIADDAPSGPPTELLSNEERVLRLVEERGGRIKQQEVVSELEWTEAKTSQVVSGLREDEEIEVFRIGRENVLALPDDGGRNET